LPGANTAKRTLAEEHIDGIGKVYVVREPGAGGDQFITGVVARLGELSFSGRAFELRMPSGVKDPSELHIDNAEAFCRRFQDCTEASSPLKIPAGKGAFPRPIPAS
jgi:hypothetical protein